MDTVKLRDLGTVITGKTPPTANSEYFGEDYPFITPSDIHTFDIRFLDAVERKLSEKGHEYQKRLMLPPKAICFVCIGSTVGKMCMTKVKSFTNQQLNSIVCDDSKCDPFYLFYKLKTATPRIQSIADGKGSGKSIISKSEFEEISIDIHPRPVQRKIASILSAYDDLIENNNRRIKILEEMAQAIYKEWFVNFRFPVHKKIKMVMSKLGMIPEGWELKQLGDVVELAYGKALKAEDRKSGLIPVYGSSGIVGYHDEGLVIGPGIIVGRKGNVGSVVWADRDFYPIDTVFYVKTSLSLHYVFYNLRGQKFINADAAVPGLNRNQAYRNLFLVPDAKILGEFQDVIDPLLGYRHTLTTKNENLRRTRDLLLPKLISGEIDAEKMDINIDIMGVNHE